MKKKIGIFCFGLCVVISLGFYVYTKNKAENVIVPQNTIYLGRDEEKIKKHLSGFPENVEEIKEKEIFVVGHVHSSGNEYWEGFVKDVEDKKKSSVDILRFGHEGQPIISYLEYNGEDFYLLTDFSSIDSESPYVVEEYSYLNCFNVPEEQFSNDLKEPVKEVVLSDENFATYEEYEKFLEAYYAAPDDDETKLEYFKIYPLSEEELLESVNEK